MADRVHRLEDMLPGKTLLRKGNEIWRVLATADEPTMTLEQIYPETGDSVCIVVSSPIAAEYERLIPESEL